MSITRRGSISFNSRVVPVFALALGMILSLIIVSSNTQQHVLAQQGAGVHQNNTTKVIGKNNESTMMLSSQQQPQLGSIAGNQFMMSLSTTNPWLSMTGSADMMDMMMPSLSITDESSNSSGVMTNSMQGPGMDMMMAGGQ
jgi:hypothetical protein